MPSPEPFSVTDKHGTTSATANTFGTAIASNSQRKGGLIQNTSAAAMLVYLGVAASAAAASSIVLGVDGILTLDLGVEGGVYQGEVAIAQGGTVAATFAAWEFTRS